MESSSPAIPLRSFCSAWWPSTFFLTQSCDPFALGANFSEQKSDHFIAPLGAIHRLQSLLDEGEVIFARRKPACALVKNVLPTIRIHDAKKTYTNPKLHGRGSLLRAEF